MQYLYHPNSGANELSLEGNDHKYVTKVRRHKVNDIIHLRTLKDDILYTYEIKQISRNSSQLALLSQKKLNIGSIKPLHIGWCIIDSKSMEKALPMLNELGVESVTFIYCDRSQKQFKIDRDRIQRILISSSQQCGRSTLMKIDTVDSLDTFLEHNKNSYLLDFSNTIINPTSKIETIVIGCEGGFTDSERNLVVDSRVVGLETAMILRSESAAVAVASILL